MSDDLTRRQQIARHWLYFYDLPGGLVPGGFSDSLMTAIQRADPGNLVRLRMAFPEEVEMFHLANRASIDETAMRALLQAASGGNE